MMIKAKLKNIPSGVGANLVFALSPVLEATYRTNTRFAPTKRIIISIYYSGAVWTEFKVLRHPFTRVKGCHKEFNNRMPNAREMAKVKLKGAPPDSIYF